MKKYILLIVITSTLLTCQRNSDRAEVKPQQSKITESVYASVNISPELTYQVQSLRSGIVEEVYVKEGELVTEGQVLFQVVAPAANEIQLLDAEINYEEAKSNFSGQNNLINNIRLDIQSLKAQLQLDSVNLKRQERLLAQNIGKRIDYDNAKLKFTNAQNQLKLLNQKLEQTKISLEKNYRKAKNKIKLEQEQLSDFNILAKMDGKVYSVNKEEGDFISTQEKIAEIGSHNSFKIEMDVDEVDITKVELGDSVLIILDAYADDVFVAKISNIYDKKNDLTRTFRVESTFLTPPPKLYYGLSGEANIVVATRENTLTIPADYLLPNNKVLTPEGEKSVRVGIKNLTYVEIRSGIDTATVLIKPEE